MPTVVCAMKLICKFRGKPSACDSLSHHPLTHISKLEMASSYDGVTIIVIFTWHFAASVAMISTDNPSIYPFLMTS